MTHLLLRMKNYTQPAIACGWESGGIVQHVHVLVQKPLGGFYSTVNVEMPHDFRHDAYKRVYFIYCSSI